MRKLVSRSPRRDSVVACNIFSASRPVLAQNDSVQVRSYSQEVRNRRGFALLEFLAQTPGTYSFKCCHSCGLGHRGLTV